MKSLHALVSQFGEPSALVDHHAPDSNCFAIWDWTDTIELSGEKLTVSGKVMEGDALQILQNQLDRWKEQSDGISAIGFISYDAKDIFYPHIPFKKAIGSVPKIWFGKPKKTREYTPGKGSDPKCDHPASLKITGGLITKDKYFRDLSTIRMNLSKGNVYQVNYTFPRQFHVNTDPFSLYLTLRDLAKPANGMYIRTDRFAILSMSPERFIRTNNSLIETFPIKGTRKRSEDINLDRSLAEELSRSEKDHAEHLMIVDLMRNDLGKICRFGSIKVDDLFGIHSFPSVHHMISRVFGQLSTGITETDIFKATFPGGSITGAPKESAMRIIDELEDYSREIYTGSLGYVTSTGDMDFNIAIRTLTIRDGVGVYPVGGGIVWDSHPEDEWNEAIQKSKILSTLLEENDDG